MLGFLGFNYRVYRMSDSDNLGEGGEGRGNAVGFQVSGKHVRDVFGD